MGDTVYILEHAKTVLTPDTPVATPTDHPTHSQNHLPPTEQEPSSSRDHPSTQLFWPKQQEQPSSPSSFPPAGQSTDNISSPSTSFDSGRWPAHPVREL